jgi:hypothetical protein
MKTTRKVTTEQKTETADRPTQVGGLAELKALLTAGHVIERVEITPALAKEILAEMPKNRPIRLARVKQYARAMRAGTWNPSLGGTISFFTSGVLADGQHRLLAVVEADVSIVVNLQPGVQTLIGQDEAATRSLADFLAMRDVPNAPAVAGATRGAYRAAVEDSSGAGIADHLRYFEQNDKVLIESGQRAHEWLDSVQIRSNRVMQAPQLAEVRAVAVLGHGLAADQVDVYLKDLVAGGVANEATRRMYERLTRSKKRRVGRTIEFLIDKLPSSKPKAAAAPKSTGQNQVREAA